MNQCKRCLGIYSQVNTAGLCEQCAVAIEVLTMQGYTVTTQQFLIDGLREENEHLKATLRKIDDAISEFGDQPDVVAQIVGEILAEMDTVLKPFKGYTDE